MFKVVKPHRGQHRNVWW